MTQVQFRRWYAEQRQEALPRPSNYQTKLELQKQIEAEINPSKDALLKARLFCFQYKDDRTITAAEPITDYKPTPPLYDFVSIDALSDENGPSQKAAMAKLENISNRLKDLLDKQLAPILPRLQTL